MHMQRVRKEALNQVDDGCIIKVFPDKLERSTTSLILKSTKTASSCRTIFMTSALKEELKKWLNQLVADERKDPTRFGEYGSTGLGSAPARAFGSVDSIAEADAQRAMLARLRAEFGLV